MSVGYGWQTLTYSRFNNCWPWAVSSKIPVSVAIYVSIVDLHLHICGSPSQSAVNKHPCLEHDETWVLGEVEGKTTRFRCLP